MRPRLCTLVSGVFQIGSDVGMRKIALKLAFCFAAFSAGMAWGVAADAAEMGLPLAQMFLS
jgi:hypothetical protein